MNRKYGFFIFLSLFVVVLVTDYFFIHILFPAKKKAFLERLFDKPPQQAMEAFPLPAGLKVRYPVEELPGENTFAAALKECIVSNEVGITDSPKDLLKRLEDRYGIRKRSLHFESLHFEKENSAKYQIHVNSTESVNPDSQEVQLFQVNAAGMPSPMESTLTDMQILIRDATLTYHHLKETIVFGNEDVAIVEWLNEEPKEFQMAENDRALSCLYLTCVCK